MKFLTTLLLNGILVYGASALLSGVSVASYLDAIIVALVLSLVNFFIRPIFTILTLPITILTLGLFLLVINGAMVLLVDYLIDGFHVQSLGWAIGFSLVLAIFNFFVGGFDQKGS